MNDEQFKCLMKVITWKIQEAHDVVGGADDEYITDTLKEILDLIKPLTS